MKAVRNIVAAIAAGSALSLGAAAFAQDAKQPEQAKPEARQEQQAERHQHRGEHRGMHGMHDMQRMREMHRGGGCQGQAGGEHNHS